jgi:3-isopropylmalate/(R)-2-methylmalate dehydratase large subunit
MYRLAKRAIVVTRRPQTLAEKIIARAAGREAVAPGEYVNVTPDYTAFQELFWPMHQKNMAIVGLEKVADPDRLVMVIDHTTSAAMGSEHTKTHRTLRDFAAQQNIKNFFPAGNGLRHQVLVERGFARPGSLIFSDEGNIASIGALGALNITMSWEVFASFYDTENWISVPKSVRMNLTGELPFAVTTRDLVQTIIRDYAAGGKLLQSCVEFAGPAISGMSLDARQTLLSCLFHAGADTSIMAADDIAVAYASERAAGRPVLALQSDPDAEFAFEATYDLAKIEPMVTRPPTLAGGTSIGAVAGQRIDQATIGSCANGRLDDLRQAAQVLRGRRIAPHVTMYITPGSNNIYADAAREGLLEVFARAGATVLGPGCTTCWGYQGVLNDGEVLISTQQFNYTGRNGSDKSDVYLSSPYVVAASAIAGEIADPRPFLKQVEAA